MAYKYSSLWMSLTLSSLRPPVAGLPVAGAPGGAEQHLVIQRGHGLVVVLAR